MFMSNGRRRLPLQLKKLLLTITIYDKTALEVNVSVREVIHRYPQRRSAAARAADCSQGRKFGLRRLPYGDSGKEG
jgi:hypothetical protein